MAIPRFRVPATAKKGDVIAIKTLIQHPMDPGFIKDKNGKIIPRMIINHFDCKYLGKVIFTAKLEPSISANPFIEFYARAEADGDFEFTWIDDKGTITKAKAPIKVTA
ncbi:MAG: thiosulfate oxidation carrier complex protein SoxZ [Hyphomicrobiales bacterium]|nr:thiosulfate oxidation carrier complex protein SoxZ [Hyphomicrobiales bacterium]